MKNRCGVQVDRMTRCELRDNGDADGLKKREKGASFSLLWFLMVLDLLMTHSISRDPTPVVGGAGSAQPHSPVLRHSHCEQTISLRERSTQCPTNVLGVSQMQLRQSSGHILAKHCQTFQSQTLWMMQSIFRLNHNISTSCIVESFFDLIHWQLEWFQLSNKFKWICPVQAKCPRLACKTSGELKKTKSNSPKTARKNFVLLTRLSIFNLKCPCQKGKSSADCLSHWNTWMGWGCQASLSSGQPAHTTAGDSN